MTERRWPWILSAVMLALSGATAAAAAYLWWLPCRGAMLVGTILETSDSPGFSDACLVRMDSGTPYPLTTAVEPHDPLLYQLAIATVVLAAVAWLVPVVTLRVTKGARAAGLAYGASLILLAVAGMRPVGREADAGPLGGVALVAVDVTVAVVLCYVLTRRRSLSTRTMVRLVMLVWATAAFGFIRVGIDYAVMCIWSSANWDIPPGTGYLPAAGLLLVSVSLVVLTVVREAPDWGSRPRASDRPASAAPVA